MRHTFYMWITSVLRWIEHCQLKTIIFREKQTAQDERAEKVKWIKKTSLILNSNPFKLTNLIYK